MWSLDVEGGILPLKSFDGCHFCHGDNRHRAFVVLYSGSSFHWLQDSRNLLFDADLVRWRNCCDYPVLPIMSLVSADQ
jgi:hypothetical protein